MANSRFLVKIGEEEFGKKNSDKSDKYLDKSDGFFSYVHIRLGKRNSDKSDKCRINRMVFCSRTMDADPFELQFGAVEIQHSIMEIQ